MKPNQMGAGHFVSSYNIRTRRRLRYEGEYMNFKRKSTTRNCAFSSFCRPQKEHMHLCSDRKWKINHFVWFTIQHIKRLITEHKVEIGLHIRFRHSTL